MSVRRLRVVSIALTIAAAWAVLFDVGPGWRVPIVLLFALLGPGLVLTSTLSDLLLVERLALAGAVGLCITIAVSLVLIHFGEWSTLSALAMISFVTLLFSGPRHGAVRLR